jgi:hypothetical protein
MSAAASTSEADVDRLVATGVITAEMATLMKASIRTSEADVDRLVATGVVTAEMAALMKSSIRKAKATPAAAPTSDAKATPAAAPTSEAESTYLDKYALHVRDELGCSIRRIPDRSTADFQPWCQTAAPTPFQSAVCAELNKLAPDSLHRRLVQAFAESDTFLQAPCEHRYFLEEALLWAICYFAIPKTAEDELSRKVVVWHDLNVRTSQPPYEPPYRHLWSKLNAISPFEWKCFNTSEFNPYPWDEAAKTFFLKVEGNECVEFRPIPTVESGRDFKVDFEAAPVHLFDCHRSGTRAPNVINYDPSQNRAIVFNQDAPRAWLRSFGVGRRGWMTMTRAPAAAPTSEADVDRLVDTGVITAEMAEDMKALIRKAETVDGKIVKIETAKGLGYVDFGHRTHASFMFGICFRNPIVGQFVKARIEAKDIKGAKRFWCLEVTLDMTREALRKAAEELYDLTGGAVTVDPAAVDEEAMKDVMTKVASLIKERARRREAINSSCTPAGES